MFGKVHVLRVKPGQELMSEITGYCQQNGISSGVILGIIGSIESARLGRTQELPAPGKYEYAYKDYTRPLSIISGQGTIALMDDKLMLHIHVLLSGPGTNEGGHLVEARVWATAEVVIGELERQLQRSIDPETGLSTLQPSPP